MSEIREITIDDIRPTAAELLAEKRHGFFTFLGLNNRTNLRFIDLLWETTTSRLDPGEKILAVAPTLYVVIAAKMPNNAVPHFVTFGALTDRRLLVPGVVTYRKRRPMLFPLPNIASFDMTQREAATKFRVPMLTLPILKPDTAGFDLRVSARQADGQLHEVLLWAPQYCERYMSQFGEVAGRLRLPTGAAAVAAP